MPFSEAKAIEELQSQFDRNVFIMMRYRSGPHFINIEDSLKKSLAKYGLIARLAKDRAFSDDLWENIQIYMRFSRFGVCVFEEIDEREFNPNISLELGYMYALDRRCLLLKDRRMPRLPTDTCGKIYKDFDIYNLASSIESQITDWCEHDLGLSVAGTETENPEPRGTLVYDSSSEDKSFTTWGLYSSIRMFSQNIKLVEIGDSDTLSEAIQISAMATEGAGMNKFVQSLFGKVKFDYEAVVSGSTILNLYFCMIPMKDDPSLLIEVGADYRSDPANAHSPYRQRYYIPHNHIGDGKWHSAEMTFDFRRTPTASYSIFGVRVNEGCPKPGPGSLLFKNVQIISYETHP